LDERTGQLLFLPRCARLTCPQPDEQVFPPRGLAGAKRQVANDAVALVEDAEHGDAFGHRSHARLVRATLTRPALRGGRLLLLLFLGTPAADERQRKE